jgi:hypothetical protein
VLLILEKIPFSIYFKAPVAGRVCIEIEIAFECEKIERNGNSSKRFA